MKNTNKPQFEQSRINQSRPPLNGTYYVGFKGKGMCSNCGCSEAVDKEKYYYTGFLCRHYGSSCKQVSRNCTGIKYLKNG
jgi:hypothetical protein